MKTRLDPEEMAYPHGGFTRRGKAILTKNEFNPIDLPYGKVRAVRASIPDTFFSIPARITHKKKRVDGFLITDDGEWYFTPEAAPENQIIERERS